MGMYITILTKRWSVYPMPNRISHQQYVSSANKLGDFLSDILNNMQMFIWYGSGNLNQEAGQGTHCQILLKGLVR
jgi:hypothetical protein